MTGLSPDVQLPWDMQYGVANSPWEVRQKIRELAHRGADHIKVLSTGAVLTHGSNPKSIEFTPEELRAAVEEAAEGIKNAIRAGVASVEHATLIDDEGIALAKQHGTYLDMDIYDEECIQSSPDTPADFLEHDQDLGEIQRRNFTKAVRAGVKMTFGTDAGVCPHGIDTRGNSRSWCRYPPPRACRLRHERGRRSTNMIHDRRGGDIECDESYWCWRHPPC